MFNQIVSYLMAGLNCIVIYNLIYVNLVKDWLFSLIIISQYATSSFLTV